MLSSGKQAARSLEDEDDDALRHEDGLDPTSKLILKAARDRGIAVQLLDQENAHFRLHKDGHSVVCYESLSDLTSALAFCRCSDKQVTARVLRAAGLSVPEQMLAETSLKNQAFLRKHRALVVKPAVGEQGRGVSVGIRDAEELNQAIARAAKVGTGKVLLEQVVFGVDLRIIVIDYEVVAASVRTPASIVGTGEHSVIDLIRVESKKRELETQGASSIPLDAETLRYVRLGGFEYESVLPRGLKLVLRGAANVHTGGTIGDVTNRLSDSLKLTAERAARALHIPVVGLDLLVPSIEGSRYWIIEANERPGFANHEPQPVAEKFVAFLFSGSH